MSSRSTRCGSCAGEPLMLIALGSLLLYLWEAAIVALLSLVL